MNKSLDRAIQYYEDDDLLKALELLESLHKSKPLVLIRIAIFIQTQVIGFKWE